MQENNVSQVKLSELVAEIVAAYVANNQVERDALPEFIASVMDGLMRASIASSRPLVEEPPVPAVSIKKSVTDDFIICLEDGQRFKSLKRHLMTKYGLTPEAYRTRWGLSADYPMVAPTYSAERSQLAMKMGLGRKAAPKPVAKATATRRNAPRKAKEAA